MAWFTKTSGAKFKCVNLSAFKPVKSEDRRGRKTQENQKDWRLLRIEELENSRPGMPLDEMATLLGVAKTTLINDRKLLIAEGKIMARSKGE